MVFKIISGLRSVSSLPTKPSKDGDTDQMSIASSDSRSSNQSDHQLPSTKCLASKPSRHPLNLRSSFISRSGAIRRSIDGDIFYTASPPATTHHSTVKPAIPKDLIRPQFMNETLLKKKQQFGQKEIEEILSSLDKLNMGKDKDLIDQFAKGGMCDESLARRLAQCLVHYAIEENRQSGRKVARLCASILDCPSGPAFHNGFNSSIMQYFECREQLRSNHLKVWIGFLNFVSDIYSSVGFTYEGGLVDTIFNIFDYMLKVPVLESLKIEELECLIASLLSVGYDLERHCPDQLVCLKNLIRDAFVEVHEPWARKMILLLMELGASGWSLPPEANEYYFQ